MNATKDFLIHLNDLNVKLWIDGDRLRCKIPKESLSAELQNQIKERKHELQSYLQQMLDANQPITSAPADRPLEMSFAQQRMWFLDQLGEQGATYNIPGALTLNGRLRKDILRAAIEEIVQRHGVLRLCFPTRDQPQPIDRGRPWFFEHDLRGNQDQETTLASLTAAESGFHFDLARGPLFRVMLVQAEEQLHYLMFTMHHIISDGWSVGIIIKELTTLFKAFSKGLPSPLPELSIQYSDFAAWQRRYLSGQVLQGLHNYWKEQLSGAPELLVLPYDRPRPVNQTFRGDSLAFTLDRDTHTRLNELCRREGATTFMALHTVFSLLLARYTGITDIPVGTPIANRNRHEIEPLIGFFVNTLVLRTDLSGNPSFTEALARVRRIALDAFAHQELPFEQVVEILQPERNPGHSPLFQVMFSLANTPNEKLVLEGLEICRFESEQDVAKFDLTLTMWEGNGRFGGSFEYNVDLFDRQTIQRAATHFQVLLTGILDQPNARVLDLPIMDAVQQRQIEVWNGNYRAASSARPVHQAFEAVAASHPKNIAVVCGDTSLTYAQLNTRANCLAAHLRHLGVGNAAPVALCLERSADSIIALLAVLKVGGVYLPLDARYPAERISFILEDTRAPVLVTHSGLDMPTSSTRVVLLDQPFPGDYTGKNLDLEVGADHDAYIIYTSGSTGRPKGVVIDHGSLADHSADFSNYYKLGATDTVLQFASFSFDASLEQIFPTLISGARLLVRPEILWSTQEFIALLNEQQVNVANIPVSYWLQMLNSQSEEALNLPHLRTIIVGGEAMPVQGVALHHKLGLSHVRLINAYGPTETTISATVYRVPLDFSAGRVPIGTPRPNRTGHVLDTRMRPVPAGVPGVLFLGGRGIARGYLNRPGLTAASFLPDPFGQVPGARLYRTGDSVRFLPGGDIDFLGRVDHQIKLRGFRIELGEIQNVLSGHPDVNEVLVLLRGKSEADKRLIAYIVPAAHHQNEAAPGEGTTDRVAALQSWLNGKLPAYMAPAAFVLLDAFPLLPSGKVDQRSLPDPRRVVGNDRVEPCNPTETRLAAVWSEVLGVDKPGVMDNFFEQGGHSLLATQMVSRIRETFGVNLPVRFVFEAPTIAQLAEHITAAEVDTEDVDALSIKALANQKPPLSYAQQRLWFIEELQDLGAAYNMVSALRLEGRLNLRALEQSFTQITARHEALRTTFSRREGNGDPHQVIHPAEPVFINISDLRRLDEAEREQQAKSLCHQEAQTPFDLFAGPLFRLHLIMLADESHILLVNMHHIISDGWSVGVLVREFAMFYASFITNQPAVAPALPIQYGDFAQWQRRRLTGSVLKRQLTYWKEHLSGAPDLLELPTDRPRPPVQTYNGANLYLQIDADLTARLNAFCRRTSVSPFMVLDTVFAILLHRYSGQQDIVLGTPVANRNHKEIEPLIGFFVNTLALRHDLSGKPAFAQMLDRVKRASLDAYAHQDVPFEQVVETLQLERSLSYSILFQAMFVLQNAPKGSLDLPGLTLSSVGIDNVTAKFDLTLFLEQAGDVMHGTLEYNTDLYDAATMVRLQNHFLVLLEGALTHPDQSIGDLPLLTPAEEHQILRAWNDTFVAHPHHIRMEVHFEAQVRKQPNEVAVVLESQTQTWAELDNRANQLAHHLIQLGVGPETLVAVYLESCIEMIVALIAVLKSGAAYLPIDPAYPEARVTFMMTDAQAPVILTRQGLVGKLPQHTAGVVCLDTDWDRVALHPTLKPVVAADSGNLAYVIYTSGSTGKPKGVLIPHHNVISLLFGANYMDFENDVQVMLQTAPITFDASTFEIWGALLHGNRLVLYTERSPNVEKLSRTIAENKVDTMWLTTALFHFTVDELPETFAGVKHLCVGGEPLSLDHVRRACLAAPGLNVINSYGPTENTCYTSNYWVPRDFPASRSSIPIGKANANTTLYILDRNLNPVPVGVPGELYTGGNGVLRGFLNRPGLSADKILPDPFSDRPGARLYRTGDLVAWLPDGNVEFLGRTDNQVKIRGFRIELGEIDGVLNDYPKLKKGVVIPREDQPGDKRLVAYMVFNGPVRSEHEQKEITLVRAYLRNNLPEYMVPTGLVIMNEFPFTTNGKIDLRALPAPDPVGSVAGYTAPCTRMEKDIADIWAQVLDLQSVGVHDNYFELGGHSLMAGQIMSRIRDRVGVTLPLRSLFTSPTVAGLSQIAERERDLAKGRHVPELVQVARDRHMPVSFAQQRLWFLERLDGSGTAYNVPVTLRLQGELDKEALRQSISAIVARHESLRTTFSLHEGKPVQTIHPASELDLPVILVPKGDEQMANALQLSQAEAQKHFDLEKGPLIRVATLQLDRDDHILMLTMHHIISDGWSMGVFIRELTSLYAARAKGETAELPPLPVQYADYAQWQRQMLSDEDTQLVYWKERLRGAPGLLQMPTDRPRSAVQTSNGAVESFVIPADLQNRLEALSRQSGATLFMTFQATLMTLLSRYSGQTDISVGTPVANRNRAEIEPLIGFFVNTLVMRCDLSDDPSFRQLLSQVINVALDAYAHQDIPFEQVVEAVQPERNLSHTPLFQVAFVYQNTPRADLALGDLKLSSLDTGKVAAKFDLTLSLQATDSGVVGGFEYNTDLFDRQTIQRLISHFQTLLEQVSAAPDQKLSSLALLEDNEQGLILGDWNDTSADFQRDACIHQLIEVQVDRTPAARAVVFEDRSLNFAELDRRANRLAHYLAARGVGPDTLVGVCCERSLELVIALVAVLKAGGAYVPLDPSYPIDRLTYMIADSGVGVLLTQAALTEMLEGTRATVITLTEDMDLDTPDTRLAVATRPDNLAYMIYTSGSTGRPKGAMNSHIALNNRIAWMQSAHGLGAMDVVLQKTPYSFDVSVWEFFWPLLTGATLVMAKPEGHKDPDYMVGVIETYGVTTMHFVPSMLQVFLAGKDLHRCASLKRVFSSGEALPLDLKRRFFRAMNAELHNLYGPTEAAIDVTYHACIDDDDNRPVPIGRPIHNTQIYILDKTGQPTPSRVAGELHIGGINLARGYLGRFALTAEKFVPDPFALAPGVRLYRTGDLARFRLDGEIEYMGRMDHQIKLRGFRIELGEIEAALENQPEISEATVLLKDDDNPRLVAYVTPNTALALTVDRIHQMEKRGELADFRRTELPNGMPVVYRNRTELDFLYREIFEDLAYDKHGISLGSDSLVFDVGANIGIGALYFGRRYEGCRIFAFEPLPPIYQVMNTNIHLNGLNVKTFNCGLSREKTRVDFTYYPNNSIISGRYADDADREVVRAFLVNKQLAETGVEPSQAELDLLLEESLKQEIHACELDTISNIIAEENITTIDLLKIDVEKSEMDVLAGIHEKDWGKIQQVVIEVHDSDGQLEIVSNLLTRHGFRFEVEQDMNLKQTGLYNIYAVRPDRIVPTQTQTPLSASAWLGPDALAQLARRRIADHLPAYMIPTDFVVLETWPITPNGKLDRKALPEPGRRFLEDYVAPTTETEIALAAIWAEVLGVERVGVTQSFFELGGHSLSATQVISRIKETFELDMGLHLLFSEPTVRGLTGHLDGQLALRDMLRADEMGDETEEIEL